METEIKNQIVENQKVVTQAVDSLSGYIGQLMEKGEAAINKGGEKALQSVSIKTVQALWQKLGGYITGRRRTKETAEKLAAIFKMEVKRSVPRNQLVNFDE